MNLIKAFVFVSVSCSCALLAYSEGSTRMADPECIQTLLPCQAYLKPPASPSATCCLVLKKMITNNVACLCSIFDNKELLSKFNVTQDDALRLPKVCGDNANLSLCKNGTAAPGASPGTPTASNSSSPSESTTHKKNAAVNLVDYSGGLSYFAIIVASLILAAM